MFNKKNIKRSFAAAMALLLFVITLSGCSADPGTPAGEISEYDSVQFIPMDNTLKEESTAEVSDAKAESREPAESHEPESREPAESHEPESREPEESYEHKDYSENVTTQESGFVVSDKMYDFKGNNLVVLNVENKTNKNYTIYIHGQYLDENGEVIKEETKEFRGFEAGWKNNFFFAPGIPFAKFTYKMETKAYSGICYGSMISLTYIWERKPSLDLFVYRDACEEFNKMVEETGISATPPNWRDYEVDSLELDVVHEYETEREIGLVERVLFLSSEGEVLLAPDVRRFKMMEGYHIGKYANHKQRPYHCYDENNAKLVEHFEKGDIVVLFSYEVAKLWDDENCWEW